MAKSESENHEEIVIDFGIGSAYEAVDKFIEGKGAGSLNFKVYSDYSAHFTAKVDFERLKHALVRVVRTYKHGDVMTYLAESDLRVAEHRLVESEKRIRIGEDEIPGYMQLEVDLSEKIKFLRHMLLREESVRDQESIDLSLAKYLEEQRAIAFMFGVSK